MAQPQRGQRLALPAQVVPQEAQVLVRPLALTQAPEYVLQGQDGAVSVPVSSSVLQADWGYIGRLKNSSHTLSANSSAGGMLQ